MKRSAFQVFLLGALLSGCAGGPMPQTGEEYRAGIAKGGFGSEMKTYEVNRPYKKVADALVSKSKECLNVKLAKNKCIRQGVANSCKAYEVFYRPTVVKTASKTQLHVQWRRDPWDSMFLGGGQPPADGLFIAAFDVEPAGPGKTKVTTYGPSIDHLKTVPNAVKHWVEGTNMGCPDLTKPYYY